MYYEEDFVEEVRQRSDVVDIISSYVNLKRTGSNYVGLCPFHNEKTASFSVSPSKQMYYCFGCGAGGNVFTFLMEYENLTFVEALERLAEQAGMELPEKGNSENDRKRRDLRDSILEVNKLAANYYFACSILSLNASGERPFINSSGSLYGRILITLTRMPASFSIGIARIAAFTPAPSLS